MTVFKPRKPRRKLSEVSTRFKVGDHVVVRWSQMHENISNWYRKGTVRWVSRRSVRDGDVLYSIEYDIQKDTSHNHWEPELLTEEEWKVEEARVRMGERIKWPTY